MNNESVLSNPQKSRQELLDEIDRLREIAGVHERRVAELVHELALQRTNLDLIAHSRSWRITAPLRLLSRWIGLARRGGHRAPGASAPKPAESSSAAPKSMAARSSLPKLTPAEFDRKAPWIDADTQAFEQGVAERRRDGRLDDGAEAHLRFFREHGWLSLKQAVPHALIDKLLADVETAWHDRLPQLVLNSSLGKPAPMAEMAQVPNFRDTSVRYLDFHHASEAAVEIMMLPAVLRFAELCFDEQVAAMQTLLFENGTQQSNHQDFAFVHTLRPACLMGAWVALEDAHVDAGPLFYWDRSHRAVPKYVFDGGSVLTEGDGPHVRAFEKYLGDSCRERGLERLIFTPRKGDVLIWHSALVHGGMPRNDPARTRRSIVSHYTTRRALPPERRSADARERNGGIYYGWLHEGHREGRYPLAALQHASA